MASLEYIRKMATPFMMDMGKIRGKEIYNEFLLSGRDVKEFTCKSTIEAESVVSWMDSIGIPAHHVAENTISVGKTYYDLYIYEEDR